MKDGKAVQLLLNENEDGHGKVIVKLLREAKRLECMVAFAKTSALNDLLGPLRKELERGLKARFAVGLDFYLTEPKALRKLLELADNHMFDLYLSNSRDTFHPKIYAFQHGDRGRVVVGSANLTHGGFYSNYEASVLVDDMNCTLMASVIQHFEVLIADTMLVPATKARIDAYEREYRIHNIYLQVAKKRAQKAAHAKGPSFLVLGEILELMMDDDSDHGFSAQRVTRRNDLQQAKKVLEEWAAAPIKVHHGFLGHFEELINLFHSGGLHRGKGRISERPSKFVEAVSDIVGKQSLSPSDAFSVLHGHFNGIPRAGINLLTEILHALDNKRFAVMNQNAVSGLALAGIREYPLHPTKQNVTANTYARYCQHADVVRQKLHLADFTELDALFNYAYWRDAAEGEATAGDPSGTDHG